MRVVICAILPEHQSHCAHSFNPWYSQSSVTEKGISAMEGYHVQEEKAVAHKIRPDGLLWSKTSPCSVEGSSPPEEPFYAYRVEYSPNRSAWIGLRLDGAYLGSGPARSLREAIEQADRSFVEYKESIEPKISELEREINNFLSSY